MTKGFRVFVNDCRKGTTYRDGFDHGYLTARGSIESWSLNGELFSSVYEAEEAMKAFGIENKTGCHSGAITGYVCEAL